MFLILLLLALVGALVHVWRAGDWSRERVGELVLRWVLAGYCGIPMLAVASVALIHPHEVAHWLGFPPDNPFEVFLGWAYLGMAVAATLALRYTGIYLIGPALVWAVFFAGATQIHLAAGGVSGMSHGGALMIFATHGLTSVVLVAALLASGILARRAGTAAL